jgi:hemerythrin
VPNDGTTALPPVLVWIDAFAIGVPELDRDHRRLIDDAAEIVELIRAARPWAEVEARAKHMAARCSAHFRREEAILEREKFEGFAWHRREHERIEAEMREIVARLASGGGPPTPAMIEAGLYFRGMLIDHLLRYDLGYKSHLLYQRGK